LSVKHAQEPRWLSILGNTGVGKTHCAKRLWEYAEARFDWHKFEFIHREIYWPKFVSDLRGGTGFEMLTEMQRWPVLFLDDIGAERDTTGFASEQLNTLLGCRMNKWTILTSNLGLGQLGEIDPRISDRIIRKPNIFIELNTKSHSLRKEVLCSALPPSDR
jgi:DNA replication protein DnaC